MNQLHVRNEKVSLEEIADVGSVGKTLCTKLFRTYTSKTPGEYLIHYRIQKSLDLLTYTRDSITDIAYAVGFSSASHYTRTFRDIMGCTPLKYRTNTVEDTASYHLVSRDNI